MAKFKVIHPHRVGDGIVRYGEVELDAKAAAPHVKAGHLVPVGPVAIDDNDDDSEGGKKGKAR